MWCERCGWWWFRGWESLQSVLGRAKGAVVGVVGVLGSVLPVRWLTWEGLQVGSPSDRREPGCTGMQTQHLCMYMYI